ncbi:LysE family translocator [Hoeflea sp.]|uniref:LysE family translocator n=1 Tax=Hoeflea sp. TaxID=1940281 RepID=UPI003B5245EE
MSIEFLVTTLIVVALPGTGVIYTLAAGLTRGGRAAALAAFGCTLGIVPHVAASVAGLAALMHTSALAFQLLKYLGVVYLFYMAWQMWRDTGALSVETADSAAGAEPTRNPLRIILAGILINLLNPKLTLFFFAFMPQFVEPGAAGATASMLALAGVFMALTFAVFLIYGLLAAQARDRMLSRPQVLRWAKRGFASAFCAIRLKLALAER